MDRFFSVVRGLVGGLALLGLTVQLPAAEQELKNTHAEDPITAKEALARLEMPEGFRATVFAAEPAIHQPIGMSMDERGRLWVAECYTYSDRNVNFDKTLRDRVVILEDPNRDGYAEKRTVFYDQASHLTSALPGLGGVWMLCAPQLIFVPDANHDDVPDGPPVVKLDGFDNDSVRHNIANGLSFGPDGWIYGRHGIQATSLVGVPGATASQRTPINCCIWRYHPITEKFEVVCHGTTNPWGHDWDQDGQLFFINTVIGHLFHVVPGANYRRMYGSDFAPHVYERIDTCADHYHWDTKKQWHEERSATGETDRLGGGHAHCGMMIYQGGMFPPQYHNQLFTMNFHGRRANVERLERVGCGYVGRHEPDIFKSGDPWFRGIELVYGPRGELYIADWSDTGECHENDGIHRTSGRIFQIQYEGPAASKVPALPANFDLTKATDAELVAYHEHPNEWYARQARRVLREKLLTDRLSNDAVPGLMKILAQSGDYRHQLRAMQTLFTLGKISDEEIDKQLLHPLEPMRVAAIQMLVDDRQIEPAHLQHLVELARHDRGGLVRSFLASAATKLPPKDRWGIVESLAMRSEDASDITQPLMIWYAAESAVASDLSRGVKIAIATRIPKLSKYIARRVTSELERSPAAVNELVIAIGASPYPEQQTVLLEGMTDALKGWRKAPVPANWNEVSTKLSSSPDENIKRLARELAMVFGDGRAQDELLKIARDDRADPQARREAVRALVESKNKEIAPLLINWIGDRILSVEAVRGLAYYDQPETADRLTAAFSKLRPEAQEEAINTFCARPAWAEHLLLAVSKGWIARTQVTAFHARQIRSLGDEKLIETLTKVWGETRESSAEKKALIASLKTSLTDESLSSADASRGRVVYQKQCANCHTLFGEGGRIGPDLTGGNRQNLDYLLENIVDPSSTVIADFKMSVLLLDDGRVVTGVVIPESDKTVALQTQKERLIIERDSISQSTQQNVSLMPEGLLQTLSSDEVRDLIAYISGRGKK